MTVGEALVRGAALLRASGIETPSLDAALLLGQILGKDRAGLVLAGPEALSEAAQARFDGSLKRRLEGECVAWILGYKEFRGLAFSVGPAVLVPRPETETLVEAALEAIDARQGRCVLLDLCTGSGAVGISIKHERPHTDVYASDISPEALTVARANAQRLLPLGGRGITFIQGDLLDKGDFLDKGDPPAKGDPPDPFSGGFDLIVSNPPYVAREELARLPREVRREPVLALDGGKEGLDLIRRIVRDARSRLNAGAPLLLEADPRQMAAITEILVQNKYRNIRTYKDLAGQERVIAGDNGM
jgi:release factor glutamine methyltransferase